MACETCSTPGCGAASRAAACRDPRRPLSESEDRVDLLETNANVLTMDDREAPASPTPSAIAIHAGKIVAVGRDQDVAAFRRPGMRVIDAGGRTVLPGFIEPHNHMVGYATALIGVDARTPPNETIADIVVRLRQAAATLPTHRWILGR